MSIFQNIMFLINLGSGQCPKYQKCI